MQKFLPYIVTVLVLVLGLNAAIAGTTGKIAGKITDAQTGETLPGVNVTLEKTHLGAATDINGYFFINNIPPGEYSVGLTLVGYQKITVNGVKVSIDLTTALSME